MRPDLVVLALDPATRTGWACSDRQAGAVDLRVNPGTGRADVAKLSEQDRHAAIGLRFYHWLDALLSETGATVLVVERQMSHGTSAHLLLGLRMLALVLARRRRMLVDECWVSSWQPWAREHCPWWRKDDIEDARAMLAHFQAERLPRMEGV